MTKQLTIKWRYAKGDSFHHPYLGDLEIIEVFPKPNHGTTYKIKHDNYLKVYNAWNMSHETHISFVSEKILAMECIRR